MSMDQPKFKMIKNSFAFSRLSRSPTIYFILFYFITTKPELKANAVITKCCPRGRVFSVADNYTCAYSGDGKPELYPLGNREIRDENLWSCVDSENLTITSIEDLVDVVINAPNACVDLLYDAGLGKSIPIVFQCHGSNESNGINGSKEVEGEIGGVTVYREITRFETLRMCCGKNRYFDVELRECTMRREEANVTSLLNFLGGAFDFVTVVAGPPVCKHAILDYVVNVTTDLRVLANASIEIVLPTNDGPRKILAKQENACLEPDPSNPDLMIVRVCTGSRFCKENACVRKCCPEDEFYVKQGCNRKPSHTPPVHFHDVLKNVSIEMASTTSTDSLNTSDYGLLIGRPCKYGMYPAEKEDSWHITPQGHVYLPFYRMYEHHEYCFDMFYGSSYLAEDIYPFVCFDGPEAADESAIRFGVNAGLELTSCAFLVVTLFVYICLPVLRNLHGKTLMCHVACLIVAYASLAAVALGTPADPGTPDSMSTHICKFLGYTVLLSWVAAFTWLNVMCFDIWWTFGGLGGAAASSGRGRAYKKRFLMYSLYAWGFSLLITTTGVIVDHTDFVAFYLRPNIGTQTCWFERTSYFYGEIIFFIGPVTLQLIANVIFFVLTALYCSKVKAEITRVMATATDPRSRRFRADRTKLIMNVKLFIVMGVSWSLEVISAFINHYAPNLSWRTEFFYASDTFNCLQGVLIFILFVLKRKVYNALRVRLGLSKKSNAAKKDLDTNGLQDPYRVRNSGSNSTLMSTFAVNTSP